MKELSIEQKAQRYDEALERAIAWRKKYVNFTISEDGTMVQDFDNIFPELKESKESEEEKIRKSLIDMLKNDEKHYLKEIAWLEKKGEQILANSAKTCKDEQKSNPCDGCVNRKGCINCEDGNMKETVDKIEPKFHKAEWLCENEPNNYARFIQILEIVNVQGKERYRISRDIHNDEDIVEFDFVEKYYHKFDIKDAKDGDVLSYRDGQWIFIYKEKIDDNSFRYHALYSTIHQDLTINDAGFTLLGSAIIPATKEQRDTLKKAMADTGYTFDFEKKELKKIEQKSSWSEEDERMYRGLHNLIYSTPYCNSRKELSDWLESFKDRVQPQAKQGWSKEDEKCIRLSTDIIDSALRAGFCVQLDRDRCVDWLKSLKDRYTWKPSDEQMLAINSSINIVGKDTINGKYLIELAEQLKKLREE